MQSESFTCLHCGRLGTYNRTSFDIPVFISTKKSLVSLKRTWDQKLSCGFMLLSFMTVHLFQFRFTVTVQFWHPSWLFNLTFFRTVNKHVPARVHDHPPLSVSLRRCCTCGHDTSHQFGERLLVHVEEHCVNGWRVCVQTGNLDSPHRVFESCIPVEVSMDVVVSFLQQGQKQCVPLLTVPNDDSGMLSWLGVVGLKRTWDQKLSSGLLLTFMTVHFFQFRFAATEQHWHPSWFFTSPFFRTDDIHVHVWRGFACLSIRYSKKFLVDPMRTWDQKFTPGLMLLTFMTVQRLLVHVEEHGADGWSYCVQCWRLAPKPIVHFDIFQVLKSVLTLALRLLTFMSIQLFQFRFAVIHFLHPNCLLTLTFFRTDIKTRSSSRS